MKVVWSALLILCLIAPVSATKIAPSPSPRPIPHRLRIGDAPDSPTKLQVFEAALINFLGIALFFWAPHPHVMFSSGNTNFTSR